MREIEIIPIARRKLERRGIPNEWVIETINHPDQDIDGYRGRRISQKKYFMKGKEYLLRVVYEKEKEVDVVLSAYLTSQIERYWKEEQDED